MPALYPSVTRLHGGVELRIGGRAAQTAIFLSDADAIDLGARLVAAGLGIPPDEIVPAPVTGLPQDERGDRA